MIDINEDSKAKFYFQHYGQQVLILDECNPPYFTWHRYLDNYLLNKMGPNYGYLLLRPISLMSYEDALHVCEMSRNDVKWSTMELEQLYVFAKHFSEWNIRGVEYLRSKGYALCWMGLSVEKMIEAGWVKLVIIENDKA